MCELQEIDVCGQRCVGRAVCAANCMAKRGYGSLPKAPVPAVGARRAQCHSGQACAECFGGRELGGSQRCAETVVCVWLRSGQLHCDQVLAAAGLDS